MQSSIKRIIGSFRIWLSGGATVDLRGSVDKFESVNSPFSQLIFGFESCIFQLNLDAPITTPSGQELMKVPVRFESGARLPNAESWNVEVRGVYDNYECAVLGNRLYCARMGYTATAFRRMNAIIALAVLVILSAAAFYAIKSLTREGLADLRNYFYSESYELVVRPKMGVISGECRRTSVVPPEPVAPGTAPRWSEGARAPVMDAAAGNERIDLNVQEKISEAIERTRRAVDECERLGYAKARYWFEKQFALILAIGGAAVLALFIVTSLASFWMFRVAGLSIIRQFLRWTRQLVEYRR